MIVFLAVRHHLYTVQSLVDGNFGPALPPVRSLAYEDAFLLPTLPAATYVFTDIERLTAWERLLAADLHGALTAAGCRCLNDPARVLTRFRLLLALHAAGINPFRAWRVAELPPPAPPSPAAPWRWRRPPAPPPGPRFPLFIRHEDDHGRPLTPLLHDPAALAAAVRDLGERRVPLAGLIAVEFCAAERWPGIWAKFGTFRVGDVLSSDHAVVEDGWCVKHGTAGLATDEVFAWEHGHVAGNSFADALRTPFALAGIEYGRADHATVDGREVVYEINTNPHFAPLSPQRTPLRDRTLATGRARFADALARLDGGDGAPLPVAGGERLAEHRERSRAVGLPFRP